MIIKYWNISTQTNKANILHAIPCLFNIPQQTYIHTKSSKSVLNGRWMFDQYHKNQENSIEMLSKKIFRKSFFKSFNLLL